MKRFITRKFAAMAVSALALTPAAVGAVLVGTDPAFAQGRSGEDAGGGSSNRGGGKERAANSERSESEDRVGSRADRGTEAAESRGRGTVASDLKALNAMNASPQALANASPDSQVGKIAAYRDAVLAGSSSYDEWTAAYNEYLKFEGSYDGPTSAKIDEALSAPELTQEQIDALEAQKLEALAYESELQALKDASNAEAEEYEVLKAAEDAALLEASSGRTLSEEALAELRAALGL